MLLTVFLLHPADLLGGLGGLVILWLFFFGLGAIAIGIVHILYKLAKWNGDRINKRKKIKESDPNESSH